MINRIAVISTQARILYLCCFVVLIGCQPSEEKEQTVNLETLNAKENGYTKIAVSLCDEVYEHAYTDSNTTSFSLDVTNDSSYFVFASDLVCGAPMGTCGQNIQVIQYTEKGYQVVFERCGNNVLESRAGNFGLLNFYYETRDGIKYKVFYDCKNFEEVPITINQLDYTKIRKIARQVGQDYRCFSPETPTDRDWESNKVVIEKVQVGPSAFAELYTVKMAPTQQFLFYNDSLILHLQALSVEVIPNSAQKFYDIKTYTSDSYAMTKDTSYYVPVFYHYSVSKKVYEKVVD